jgi:uncharacterized protein YkwD
MKFILSTCAALVLTTSAVEAEVLRVKWAGITSTQKSLLAKVNLVRAENAKPPLCLNAKLANASQEHAYDMATGGWVGTTGTSGSSPTSRAAEQGFNSPVAEMVGAGYATDPAMLEWLRSPANSMYLLGDYKYMGGGYGANLAQTYKFFWVLDFAGETAGEVCA